MILMNWYNDKTEVGKMINDVIKEINTIKIGILLLTLLVPIVASVTIMVITLKKSSKQNLLNIKNLNNNHIKQVALLKKHHKDQIKLMIKHNIKQTQKDIVLNLNEKITEISFYLIGIDTVTHPLETIRRISVLTGYLETVGSSIKKIETVKGEFESKVISLFGSINGALSKLEENQKFERKYYVPIDDDIEELRKYMKVLIEALF